MRAASSSSAGTCVKKFRSRKIANGSPNATWNRMTPTTLPKIPSVPKSRASGMSATWIGTANSTITAMSSQSRPGNCRNAKPYAAIAAIITTSTVPGTAITIVFQNEPVIVGFDSRLT